VESGDPERSRCARGLDDYFFSAMEELPGVGLMDTRDAARQGGFPAPVLTHESMYLSLSQYEIYVLKRSYTGKGLGDPLDLP
jgi:hypothetical protein